MARRRFRGKLVEIKVKNLPNAVRFYTDVPSLPVTDVPIAKVGQSYSLFTEHRHYAVKLIGMGVNVDWVKRPNLFAAYVNMGVSKRKQPKPTDDDIQYVDESAINTPIRATEPEYETNMVEALVGFKSWKIKDGRLLMTTYSQVWKPGEAVEAFCPNKRCQNSPGLENCTCGIYAADTAEDAHTYGSIHGKIYGWGRYVRGGNGWRAQMAYPHSFILEPEQIKYVDLLKEFHVPVYMISPLLVYNPSEDGFVGAENEDREDSPNWNSRASAESDSEENNCPF
jgi:hypothetical protein